LTDIKMRCNRDLRNAIMTLQFESAGKRNAFKDSNEPKSKRANLGKQKRTGTKKKSEEFDIEEFDADTFL